MKNSQEKIHIADLLNCYSLSQLQTYTNCPSVLATQMKDVQTLLHLAETQFVELVVDLRKKSLEYQKTIKACDKLSKQIAREVQNMRKTSNPNFAYSIHSLRGEPIIPQFTHRKLLVELKLKFLESQEVTDKNWEEWFIPQQKVLLLRDANEQYEVKIGIGLAEIAPYELQWKIFDVKFNKHNHRLLYYFLVEYMEWMRKQVYNWQAQFINRMRLILTNLPTMFLFLEVRNEIAFRKGQVDGQTLKLNISNNGVIYRYMWKFEIFNCLDTPKVQFYINEQPIYTVRFAKGYYHGQILLYLAERLIVIKPRQHLLLNNRNFLYSFTIQVHNFIIDLQKFQAKYSSLAQQYSIFLTLEGAIWKSQLLQIQEEQYVVASINSLWGQITCQNGIIFRIQSDLSLSYPPLERGLFGNLLSQLSLAQVLLHIRLRVQILKNNRQCEFKLSKISFQQSQKYILYEFKSFKYNEQQRLFKLSKQEESIAQISGQSNDNFILTMRVHSDFSNVSYSAYKMAEGPSQQRQILACFLPKNWLRYQENKRKQEKYDWTKIAECMIYLCKCYLVERSYHRRMTEPQKKMTVFSFK